MKKSILVATVLAFAVMSAGPANAVRGKEKDAKGAQSKATAVSSGAVQSKAGAQSKASSASAASAAQASKAKSSMSK